MQIAALCPLIERLNIFQSMVEAITTEVDFIFRDRIEHEGVVGIRRMTKGKDFMGVLRHLEL